MKKYVLISIDLQNDFATENGPHYKVRPSIGFNKNTLFPYLREKGIKIAEIISDYRQPRPGDSGECCIPGTWGYESIVPKDIVKSQWIKCMNSPVWIREGIGDTTKKAGLPFQDTKSFGEWLDINVGNREEATPILFGLTLDCCVLSTLQELNWRGYYPKVLYEAVDHYEATKELKDKVIESVVTNWAEVIHWDELIKEL